MTDLQNNNRQILCNMLPTHVAAHFIDLGQRSHMVKRYKLSMLLSSGELSKCDSKELNLYFSLFELSLDLFKTILSLMLSPCL